MMTNKIIIGNTWSRLPNAAHIDRVIASAKSHSEIWEAAWRGTDGAAWLTARDAATHATINADRIAARNAAWYHVHGGAARGAILALIAYDDSVQWLDMSSDKLKIWVELSEEPAAILMLPSVMAFERLRDMEAA